MKYADTVVKAVRVTIRNPFAVILVSIATSVSLLPFLTGIFLAGAFGGLVGLWTSSFMLGAVGVGGARIATVVLEREVSLGTSYFWEGISDGPKMAAAVGSGTFLVAALALVLAQNPLTGVPGLSVILLGAYAVVGWFTLAVFALTCWASDGDPQSVSASFRDGGRLILERPVAAVWLVVQAIGWALIMIPLIIAPAVVLPGFVLFIGTAVVQRAAETDTE
ncbi:hypothetical protein Harman_23500 [Haloarcula mannanilytica]|uniref:DUF624 domain-containing protein n=1 Tax=Haloarcula mannanilytica TaxID=2509225 RepID=A0A4C2EJ68_9EURY|nr:hypothetical protein [Haloarcula mannanilytica]GCF14415.1 hypothetical protein Harman_23500 [Haloarcula mannanilytica]